MSSEYHAVQFITTRPQGWTHSLIMTPVTKNCTRTMTVEHVLPNKVDTKCALMKVFYFKWSPRTLDLDCVACFELDLRSKKNTCPLTNCLFHCSTFSIYNCYCPLLLLYFWSLLPLWSPSEGKFTLCHYCRSLLCIYKDHMMMWQSLCFRFNGKRARAPEADHVCDQQVALSIYWLFKVYYGSVVFDLELSDTHPSRPLLGTPC